MSRSLVYLRFSSIFSDEVMAKRDSRFSAALLPPSFWDCFDSLLVAVFFGVPKCPINPPTNKPRKHTHNVNQAQR